MPVHPIREIQFVLRMKHQLRVQAAWYVCIRNAVYGRVQQRTLLVPWDILILSFGRISRRSPPTNGVPVFYISPVLVSDIEVQQHVIDELRHIEVALHLVVQRIRRDVPHRRHRIVHIVVAVPDLALVVNGVVGFRSPHQLLRESIDRLFRKVIGSPVEAIDKQVEKAMIARNVTHGPERVLRPRIANPRGARTLKGSIAVSGVVTPMPPGTVEIRPQNNVVVILNRRVWEQWIVKRRLAEVSLELELKSVLRVLERIAARITVTADSTNNRECRRAVG